jgi:hypothetical protein
VGLAGCLNLGDLGDGGRSFLGEIGSGFAIVTGGSESCRDGPD